MSGTSEMSTLVKVLLGIIGMILLVGGGFCTFTSLLFIAFWQISLITLPIALAAGYLGWRIVQKVSKSKKNGRPNTIVDAENAPDIPVS